MSHAKGCTKSIPPQKVLGHVLGPRSRKLCTVPSARTFVTLCVRHIVRGAGTDTRARPTVPHERPERLTAQEPSAPVPARLRPPPCRRRFEGEVRVRLIRVGVWVVGVWVGWCLLVGVSGCPRVVVWWVALVVRVGGFAVGVVLCACRSGCVLWYYFVVGRMRIPTDRSRDLPRARLGRVAEEAWLLRSVRLHPS